VALASHFPDGRALYRDPSLDLPFGWGFPFGRLGWPPRPYSPPPGFLRRSNCSGAQIPWSFLGKKTQETIVSCCTGKRDGADPAIRRGRPGDPRKSSHSRKLPSVQAPMAGGGRLTEPKLPNCSRIDHKLQFGNVRRPRPSGAMISINFGMTYLPRPGCETRRGFFALQRAAGGTPGLLMSGAHVRRGAESDLLPRRENENLPKQ
jgi:hypothetical protein